MTVLQKCAMGEIPPISPPFLGPVNCNGFFEGWHIQSDYRNDAPEFDYTTPPPPPKPLPGLFSETKWNNIPLFQFSAMQTIPEIIKLLKTNKFDHFNNHFPVFNKIMKTNFFSVPWNRPTTEGGECQKTSGNLKMIIWRQNDGSTKKGRVSQTSRERLRGGAVLHVWNPLHHFVFL